MSVIETLIKEKMKEQEQHHLEQLEKDREEKEQIRRCHQERLDYLHSELGDAWYELMHFSQVKEYDQFTSILKVAAMEFELAPFFVKVTSRVARGFEGKLQISFYVNDENWPHYDFAQFLANMHSDYPRWKEEQSLKAYAAEIEQQYRVDYAGWLAQCENINSDNRKLIEAKQQELDRYEFSLWQLWCDEEISFDWQYVLADETDNDGYWTFWTRSGARKIKIYRPIALEYLGRFNPQNSPSDTQYEFIGGYWLQYGPDTTSEELLAWALENLTDLPEDPERPAELNWKEIERVQNDVREGIAELESKIVEQLNRGFEIVGIIEE